MFENASAKLNGNQAILSTPADKCMIKHLIVELCNEHRYQNGYYQGYPKILAQLGIDYRKFKTRDDLELELKKISANLSNRSMVNILEAAKNKEFGNTMELLHPRLRFIERYVADNADVTQICDISVYIKDFYQNLTDAINQKVIISSYKAYRKDLEDMVVYVYIDGKKQKIGFDKKLQIHTLYTINN